MFMVQLIEDEKATLAEFGSVETSSPLAPLRAKIVDYKY
jgi:hypothetical protein